MATIRDVARRAGVAVSTASLALNGRPHVSELTRTRVLEAAKELDYWPDALGRRLVTGRAHTVSLVNPVPINSVFAGGFFGELVKGMYEALTGSGFTLSLSIVDGEEQVTPLVEDLVRSRSVDGLVVTNPSHHSLYLRRLAELRFPTVVLGRPPEGCEGLSSVDSDNVQVAYTATKHLVQLGHRHIVFLTGAPHLTFCADRLAGYRAALEEAGLPFEPALVWPEGFSPRDPSQLAHLVLAGQLRCTAVFATSEGQAVGVIKALGDAGRAVPGDVAVVAVGDSELTRNFRPAITAVDLHTRELGRQAAALLLSRMERPETPPQRHLVDSILVVRDSCGARQVL